MAEDQSIEEIRQRKLEQLRSQTQDTDSGAADESPASPQEPIHVDGPQHLSDIVAEHSLVLADFYADWCGPCQMLEPIVADIAAETPATVAKVDIDAHQQLATEYGVRGVPTLVFFANGEPVERRVGMQQKPQLLELVDSYR